MTHINQTDGVNVVGKSANDTFDDLFGMQLQYNTGSTPLYNGNISSLSWQTNRGNVQADALRSYDFTYDQMNRLLSATYSGTGSENFHVSGITYDLNGNIESLLRNGKTGPGANDFGVMDNLNYTYVGNRLRSIQENAIATIIDEVDQFHTLNNNDTLGYDASGNITYDPNKGITYTYNHFNKPIAADFSGGKKISWIYSADGTKLVQVYSGDSAATHDYVGGFFYKDDQLLHLAHEEGRALNLSGIFRYEFNLTDHLGNVRVSFSDINYDGVIDTNEVLQTDHYYPFGLRLGGLSYQSGTENRYRYNGKELHQEFNLGLYDYGARMYDPTIGRWNGVDVQADSFLSISPFVYVANNPLKFINPNGEDIVISLAEGAGKNGEDIYTINITGKIVDDTRKGISSKQLARIASRIESQIERSFSGSSQRENTIFRTNATISVESESNPLEQTDHAFRLVDEVPGGENQNPNESRVGHGPAGQNVVYIKASSSHDKIRTAAHELGHSASLAHIKEEVEITRDNQFIQLTVNDHPGNLMHQSRDRNRQGQPVAGTKIEPFQIRKMLRSYRNGQLNKGRQR